MSDLPAGVKQVQERHRFDEARLQEYLANNIDGFAGPMQVYQFVGSELGGGQSNPTYLLITTGQRYVLRRKPPGKLLPSAHAVDREFRVISAVHSVGFPVPRPYLLCEDESIVGTIFYVMAPCEGRVYFDRSMPDLSPPQRGELLHDFLRVLALLHSYDYKALGLEDFGRPGNYFGRQISRWTKQYLASQTQDIPAMDRLIEWLPEQIPNDDTDVLVHGDYSLHNVMTHPTQPRLVAVLDWELSTIGHPLGDLFYALSPWFGPGMSFTGKSEAELTELGIPTFERMVQSYCELSGRPMVPNPGFYKAYILFRLAGILQGIVGRARDGTASSPQAEAMATQVGPLAEAAWREAQEV